MSRGSPRTYNPAVPRDRRRPAPSIWLHRVAALVLFVLVAALGSTLRLVAQEEWRESAEIVTRYEISARLREVRDHGDRLRIVGEERVEWRNTSEHSVGSLYFHLYANAFRNTRSSWLREAARDGWKAPDGQQYGGVDVQEIALVTGEKLELDFVSPDDGNADDRTVARVALPTPIGPGETVVVRLRFTTSLPTTIARMGRHGDFVMAAQWFPKLGRYVGPDAGWENLQEGWHCHQFHRSTEFFADFSDYEVELRVPDDKKTGATGELVETSVDEKTGMRRELWRASNVVDFAWTAHERYEVVERVVHPFRAPPGVAVSEDRVIAERDRIANVLGVDPAELALPPVTVRVMIQPEHAHQLDRHFEAVRVAIGLYGLWLGPYPFDRLTIVDPAHGAKSGGMEYPMLVTAGTRSGNPPSSLRPEGVTVHEVGHQWFMNVLASNEAEEAWLDEGLNTYFTARALSAGYGPAIGTTSVMGEPTSVTPFFAFGGLGHGWPEFLGLPDWAAPPEVSVFRAWRDLPWLTALPTPTFRDDPLHPRRRSYLRRESWDDLPKPGWEYLDRRSYGVNAYSRPALFIATLRRSLHARLGAEAGERAFVTAFREYGRRYRFRHPTGADFLATFSEVSGLDVEALAVPLMRSSGALDYAIERLDIVREPKLAGRVGEGPAVVEITVEVTAEDDESERPERTEVLVRRRGEVIVPVRLQVTRDDGPLDDATWETVEWDGRDRYRRFEFDGKIRAARLHPDAEYPQDGDRRNDSRTRDASYRPGVKWGVRFLLWLENAALSYGRFL